MPANDYILAYRGVIFFYPQSSKLHMKSTGFLHFLSAIRESVANFFLNYNSYNLQISLEFPYNITVFLQSVHIIRPGFARREQIQSLMGYI